MKKRFLTLILTVIATFTCGFGLVACNQGQGGGSSQSGAGEGAGEVPVYQGMTISNGQATAATAKNMSVGLMSAKTPGNTDNNGKHNGWYKGDHNDKDHHVDQENPFPDNESDENIENEMESSLDIIGAGQEIYYATANEDVYINIHITNSDNYEILSFTLNGEKYSSYMFEKGSDMETLILKYNVGDNSGIQEYTIDAIKYIDGTEIKDVIMEGDKTVVAGIRRDDQVTATVSNLSIGFNDVALTVNVADEDNLIEYSQGCLKAVIYDGESIVATKDLVVGNNDVTFDNLGTMTLYQYAIVGYYDAFSGEGVALNTLFKEAFYTKAIVLFDNIEISQEDIQFSFLWDNDFQNKTLTSLTLFKGEEETNLLTTAIYADGLLSNTVYSLVAEYKNGEETESISLEFKTEAKATPVVEIANVTTTSTSVSFAINETDTDNLGEITKIELIHTNGTVVADSVDVREFTGLLSNNNYTVKVSYTYDLNDGVGAQEIVKTFDIETEAKATPVVEIVNATKTQTSLSFAINETDMDNVGVITKIELVHETDGVIVADNVEVRNFENLTSLYSNNCTLRISYAYDLNDGLGLQEIFVETYFEAGSQGLAYRSIEGGWEVSGLGSCQEGDIGIPSVYKGEPVVSIGDSAFIDCDNLMSVEIFDGVTSIGDSAFSNCNSLTSVTIGGGVTSIGSSAFQTCRKLVEVVNKSPHITIEKGSTDNGYVGYCALAVYNSGDIFVSKLSNDNGYIIYTEDEEKILVNYTGTETDLTLPSYITKINQYAFYNCASLTSVTIPDNVSSIGNEAFRDCTSMTEITLPFVGESKKATGHESRFVHIFGDSEEENDYGYLCDYIPASLSKVTITGGDIGEYAFWGCESVRRITLSDGITSIGEYAFYLCDCLTSIIIPDSVTSIGEAAFSGCSSLTSVYISSIEAWCNISFSDSMANPLYYAENLYLNNELVAEVEIPNTVTEIKDYAFYGYSNLTNLVIGDGVTSIGSSTFRYCSGLTSVIIPDNVTSIGSCAFENCTNLTSLGISDSVTSIGDWAFSNSNSITSLTCPTFAISYITKNVLQTVVITSGDLIPYRAFRYCDSLTSVVIGDSVTSIGEYAFCYCASLTSITIPDSVTSIGQNAFYDCDNLTSVVIGDSVTSIGDKVFRNCDSLTSLVIGKSVTSIGEMAIRECTSLTDITFNGTVEEWNAIVKGSSWRYQVPATKVVCSDGEVAL